MNGGGTRKSNTKWYRNVAGIAATGKALRLVMTDATNKQKNKGN